MNDHEVLRRLIIEIGRQLREGATGVKMEDALESIGVKVEDPIKRQELWSDVWEDIVSLGLVDRAHDSSRESTSIDFVALSDWGRDPAHWENWDD